MFSIIVVAVVIITVIIIIIPPSKCVRYITREGEKRHLIFHPISHEMNKISVKITGNSTLGSLPMHLV